MTDTKPRLFTDADVERATKTAYDFDRSPCLSKWEEIAATEYGDRWRKAVHAALESGLSPEARRVLELIAEITDFRTSSLRDQLQLQVAILDYARSLQKEPTGD